MTDTNNPRCSRISYGQLRLYNKTDQLRACSSRDGHLTGSSAILAQSMSFWQGKSKHSAPLQKVLRHSISCTQLIAPSDGPQNDFYSTLHQRFLLKCLRLISATSLEALSAPRAAADDCSVPLCAMLWRLMCAKLSDKESFIPGRTALILCHNSSAASCRPGVLNRTVSNIVHNQSRHEPRPGRLG